MQVRFRVMKRTGQLTVVQLLAFMDVVSPLVHPG